MIAERLDNPLLTLYRVYIVFLFFHRKNQVFLTVSVINISSIFLIFEHNFKLNLSEHLGDLL